MSALSLMLIALMAIVSKATTNSSTSAHASATTTDPLSNITITILPVPASTGAFIFDDSAAAAHLGYQPTYNVDYPGQDIFPWFWTATYENCLQRCESYNANRTRKMTKEKIVCKAALFAPARFAGRNDCYLKKSLNKPQLSNVTLFGGIKIESNETASSGLSSGHASRTRCPSTASSKSSTNSTKSSHIPSNTGSSGFDTHTVHTKSASSSCQSDTGRPSISSTPDSTEHPKPEPASISSPSTTSLPHIATATELRPSDPSPPAVLTLPTTDHTHGA